MSDLETFLLVVAIHCCEMAARPSRSGIGQD